MGYSAENYRIAKEVIEQRRLAAIAESEQRREELHRRSPEAAEIDAALRRTGMSLFRAACAGGKDSPEFLRVMHDNQALLEARSALLAGLGLPPDYTEVHYACPACGDTGYVDIHMCTCLRRELTLATFRSSGLGALLDRQTFDNFSLDYYRADPQNLHIMEQTLSLARQYADGFSLASGNLLFLGRTGLGKTHLSTAIARTVIERGYDVRYDSAQNIFADFEYDRFRAKREEDGERSRRSLTADLLILDDLGTEISNSFSVSCFYHLVNARLVAGRPTILSTNLSEEELCERYGDRSTSRLLGEYRPLLFVGEDIRRLKLG